VEIFVNNITYCGSNLSIKQNDDNYEQTNFTKIKLKFKKMLTGSCLYTHSSRQFWIK